MKKLIILTLLFIQSALSTQLSVRPLPLSTQLSVRPLTLDRGYYQLNRPGLKPIESFEDILSRVELGFKRDKYIHDSIGLESATFDIYVISQKEYLSTLHYINKIMASLKLEFSYENQSYFQKGMTNGTHIRVVDIQSKYVYDALKDSILNLKNESITITYKESEYKTRKDIDSLKNFIEIINKTPFENKDYVKSYFIKLFKYNQNSYSIQGVPWVFISIGDESEVIKDKNQQTYNNENEGRQREDKPRSVNVLEVAIIVSVALGVSVVILLIIVMFLVMKVNRNEKTAAV